MNNTNTSSLLLGALVLTSLSLVGISCSQQQEPLPEGETTSDVTAPVQEATTEGLIAGAPADGSNGSLTIDLLPPDDAASADTTGDLSALAEANEVGTVSSSSDDADDTDTASEESTSSTATSGGLGDLVATPLDDEDVATLEEMEEATNDALRSDNDSSNAATKPEKEVQTLAEQLVESFGSYTNRDEVPFQNLEDVLPYATKSMKAYLESLKENGSSGDGEPFFGRTTTALSSAVVEMGSKKATVFVLGEREDISGERSKPVASIVLMRVELEKTDGEWLVDGIFEEAVTDTE